MGYPKNMSHEELHAFASLLVPDDPTIAVHLVYPSSPADISAQPATSGSAKSLEERLCNVMRAEVKEE